MPVTISRSETHPDCIVIDLGRTIPTALGCDFVLSDSSSGQFASPDGWRAERHVFKPLEIVRSNTTRLVIPFEHVATIVPGTMVSLLIGASSFRAQMNWPPDLAGPVANPDPPATNTAELEGVSEPTVAKSLVDPLEQPTSLDADKVDPLPELSSAEALNRPRSRIGGLVATGPILVCTAALAVGGWYVLNKHNELAVLQTAVSHDRALLDQQNSALLIEQMRLSRDRDELTRKTDELTRDRKAHTDVLAIVAKTRAEIETTRKQLDDAKRKVESEWQFRVGAELPSIYAAVATDSTGRWWSIRGMSTQRTANENVKKQCDTESTIGNCGILTLTNRCFVIARGLGGFGWVVRNTRSEAVEVATTTCNTRFSPCAVTYEGIFCDNGS